MMLRYPEFIPLKSGVFALRNDKRRIVYVSWTQNLQKRSHSMSHMLLQYDEWLTKSKKAQPYWPIRDLPKHVSDEWVFTVEVAGSAVLNAAGTVSDVQTKYRRKGYAIVGGHRAASGMVRVDGQRMRLADAVREYSKEEYLTVYRRLQRGWTVRQALGLDPPDPRWHTARQKARKAREAERAAA